MPRRLSDEDREIWERVARTARRLRPSPDPAPDTRTGAVPDPDAPPPRRRAETPVVPPRRPRPSGHDLAPSLDQALAAAPLRMDAGLHRKLKRGKLTPESRIDLHGMTRAQAQPVLTGFLLGAHARGERLVLVITGKGREAADDDLPVPRRPGALRHDLPHWLSQAPLRGIVLDLRPAHRSHGGGGAFYVYLRRAR